MTPAEGDDLLSPDPGAAGSGAHRSRLSSSYWWLLSAAGASGLGNGLVSVALPLLAVTVTHRPLAVAGVAIAGEIPWLIVSVPAGALADRVNRRRLVVAIEGVRAVVLGFLAIVVLSGRTSLPILYLAAFTVGALETAFSASTRASLQALVHPDDLPRANGYLFATETAGEQFAGPAVGGVLFGWSAAIPFLGDAVSFAASAVLLSVGMPTGQTGQRPTELTFVGDVRVGLRWFRQDTVLRHLAPIVATFAFCQSAVLSVIVLYGLHVLHLSSAGYGVFLAFGATGDVAGSLLAGRAHTRLGPARAIVVAGITAAAGYLLLAATSITAVAVFGYALEAIAVALGNVATISLRQQLIPTELFGRVDNAFRTCVYGAIPVGALAGGLLATVVGLQATFLVAGLIQLLVIAATARRLVKEITQFSPPTI